MDYVNLTFDKVLNLSGKEIMIIAAEKDQIIVIHNRHHAFLASQLASNLHKDIRIYVRDWLEHLIAIASHDDSYQISNKRYYIDEKGAPKDFKNVALDPKLTIAFLKNLELKSQWIYVMSLCHLYERFQKQNKVNNELQKFVKTEKLKICKQLKITMKTAQQGHQILKWADSFSMALCRNIGQKGSWSKQLAMLPGDIASKIWVNQNNVIIQPNVINKEFKRFTVEYKIIPNRTYEDDEDLFKTLSKTPSKHKEWIVSALNYSDEKQISYSK